MDGEKIAVRSIDMRKLPRAAVTNVHHAFWMVKYSMPDMKFKQEVLKYQFGISQHTQTLAMLNFLGLLDHGLLKDEILDCRDDELRFCSYITKQVVTAYQNALPGSELANRISQIGTKEFKVFSDTKLPEVSDPSRNCVLAIHEALLKIQTIGWKWLDRWCPPGPESKNRVVSGPAKVRVPLPASTAPTQPATTVLKFRLGADATSENEATVKFKNPATLEELLRLSVLLQDRFEELRCAIESPTHDS